MYAVVRTGGKQYRVEAGSELTIERLGGDAGSPVTFDSVLLVGDGDTITVGTPTVAGATVSGTVIGESLGPKLVVFKFKQKVKYRRMAGHRQHFTRVRIDEISASGKRSTAEKPEAASAAAAEAKPEKAAKRTRTAKADAPATEAEAETGAEAASAAEAKPKPKRTRKPATAKAAEESATPEAKKRTRKPAAPKAQAEE